MIHYPSSPFECSNMFVSTSPWKLVHTSYLSDL